MPNPKDTRIVFFGNERLATGIRTSAPTLQALIEAGYDVAAVASHNEVSKSRKNRELEIAAVAEVHGIPVLLPHKPSEIIDELKSFKADIGVLVAYGKIVPQSVMDVFPHGIINIHPSLLPLHRGPIPVESIILEGAKQTGVSIMQLAPAMDAGPVYDQTTVLLRGDESKQELAECLLEHGKMMLLETLPGIVDGSLQPKPQNDSKATYDALIRKEDGILDFAKPAERLEREIRAYAEWPRSRTTLAGRDVAITAAHAVPSGFGNPGDIEVLADVGMIAIQCGAGYLCVERLIPAGKKEMTSREFIAGYGRLLQ